MDCNTPGFPVHQQLPELLKLMSTELVMPCNRLVLCHPLFLPPPIFPSISVFSNESALHIRWPKYWSFSFSISSFNEYSRLISFRMDWLDLLALQGTLKSLLQCHSWRASILQCSAFFIAQLSHPYTTTEKTVALTRWTLVGKIMSLLFNMWELVPHYTRFFTIWATRGSPFSQVPTLLCPWEKGWYKIYPCMLLLFFNLN